MLLISITENSMTKTCCSKGLWLCSIAVATAANILLIEKSSPMVGIWGLVMQILYSMHLNCLPSINFKSARFYALCGECFITGWLPSEKISPLNCCWLYLLCSWSLSAKMSLVLHSPTPRVWGLVAYGCWNMDYTFDLHLFLLLWGKPKKLGKSKSSRSWIMQQWRMHKDMILRQIQRGQHWEFGYNRVETYSINFFS